jgi:hypothetical protein
LKRELDEVFPNLSEFFPGKPVETNKGKGFVVEKRSSSCVVQYEKGRETETVPIDMIVKEKDSDEIKYDQK